MKRALHGNSIAFAIRSFDHSLFTHLIPTTNRKNEHPHEIRLENGKNAV